jgi:Phosphotransferase enzyme family
VNSSAATAPHASLLGLCDEALLAGALDAWLAQTGQAPAASWRREYTRRHPGQNPWAVCLYEADDGRLIRIDALHSPQADASAHARLGPLRFAAFPSDPVLTTLGAVMARLERAQVVRYRPGQRCTLRGFVAGAERFVKVVLGGERLYRDALTLWAGYRDGALSTAVAEPHAWDEATHSFWQGVVPGRPVVADVLGSHGDRFTRRLGAALGELAGSGLKASVSHAATHQLARTGRAIDRIAQALPALHGRLEAVRHELARRHADLPERRLVPIHGAPHMHQWLVGEGRLGLVDFDRFALGEPEFDLATFVAELDTERALVCPIASIEAAMVEGYADRGIQIDPARARLYRAHKRLSKVMRTVWAVRPDVATRAGRHLGSVESLLEST